MTADELDRRANARHERQHQAETRAFASWHRLQLHVFPQVQASPHWHDAAGRAEGFWQPHLHSEPVQTPQVQTFD